MRDRRAFASSVGTALVLFASACGSAGTAAPAAHPHAPEPTPAAPSPRGEPEVHDLTDEATLPNADALPEAPADGAVYEKPDGTCWWYKEITCPPRTECTLPPKKQVTCPERDSPSPAGD